MPKLTKTLVDNTKAPAKGDTWLWDSEVEGFGVRVQYSGRKTYIIRYRTNDASKTQRKLTLARCSDMPPEKARELARKKFAEVAEGGDPAADKKPQPAAKEAPKTATVGMMFEGYVASMRAKNRASAEEVNRVLLLAKNNAADALGRDRKACDVAPIDVVNYVSQFYIAGYRGAADKARSYIASAYTWAMRSANDYTAEARQDWGIQLNPAAVVAKDSGAIKTRDRNLDKAELRKLWAAAEPGAAHFSPEVAACIRLLIGCGQRVQETLRIDGADIDLDAALWKMPAHKTKGRKLPHTIPLPRQVLPILRDLILEHGDGPLFPARTNNEGQFVGVGGLMAHRSINQAIGRWLNSPEVSMDHFQTRDLRRTWKSRSHDAGVDRFTRDLIQQHAKSDTGSKNYDRADYLPQMRAAMAKWSDWLDEMLTDPKLIAFKLAA
jgi:integrase